MLFNHDSLGSDIDARPVHLIKGGIARLPGAQGPGSALPENQQDPILPIHEPIYFPTPRGVSRRAVLLGLPFCLLIAVGEPYGVLVLSASPLAADFFQ